VPVGIGERSVGPGVIRIELNGILQIADRSSNIFLVNLIENVLSLKEKPVRRFILRTAFVFRPVLPGAKNAL